MAPLWRCVSLVLILLTIPACDDNDPVLPGPSRAPRTLSVAPDGSGEYPTIQAAIDASIDGDTISLDNGRYDDDGNRDLDFGGRAILLKSRSGNPVFCLIDSNGTQNDLHRGIWFHSDETSQSIVEGISIEDGYHTGGAAVLCEDASPTFRGVVFCKNNSSTVDCRFGASPAFFGCTFRDNLGPGLVCYIGSTVSVVDCLFMQNYSGGSGAGIVNVSSNVSLETCTFLRNGAVFSGAAIECLTMSESPMRANLSATRCQFLDNTAGYHGGAVDCSKADFQFTDCVFAGNACGINGGAFWCYFESAGKMSNCVLYGNEATKGAAVNIGWTSSLTLESTIVAFNQGSAAVYCDTLFGSVEPALQCTDVYGNSGGDWVGCIADLDSTNNNISVDPMFCDAASDDFFLRPESPLLALPCGPSGGWPVGCAASRR